MTLLPPLPAAGLPPDALGSHRVLEPAGALPQSARRLDNTPVVRENEMLCDVDVLQIDSASFRQMREAYADDPARIGNHIAQNVKRFGKQHNHITGSGGMFVGRVREIGARMRTAPNLRPGDRIASLVSLTLTPLHLTEITHVDLSTGKVRVRGQAILFQSGLWAGLPEDIETDVALAALDVAGAAAGVRRMAAPGSDVVVIGADGKSGLLACANAKSKNARVIGVVPDASTEGAQLLVSQRLVDTLLELDARDAASVNAAIANALPALADLTVNCVNVPGTELASILCTKERGTVYFFSMCTSFTCAALGAEGIGKDVTMIVGNGYVHGHADIALQTLRANPALHAYFRKRFAHQSIVRNP
ncbi:MAG: L-erythro-3,5-diaminohexanoate dehydrogenase [Vulcanimicrobiaceae bacterium]